MSRRKRQPEEFDVVEFLRESDADLKSAINTLLRSPQPDPKLTPDLNLRPAPDLIPPPDLSPGAILAAPPVLEANIDLGPDSKLTDGVKLAPGAELNVVQKGIPGVKLTPGPILTSGPELPRRRRFPIREMKVPRDAHTRAEQQVYERLWEMGTPAEDGSRTITMGFGAMARLVGLSESNARINMRSLIAKLAIEGVTEYNCAQSIGRTYRIFPPDEIMKRRREAGLLWYMRRTLAVVFVNTLTGQPIYHKRPAQRSLNNLHS
jgi:hypothetical protein